MANFIKVNVEGMKEQMNYKFEDDKPVKGIAGKKSGIKVIEFLMACGTLKSFEMHDFVISLNAEDGHLAHGYYIEIKDGEGVVTDDDDEPRHIEGMLNTITDELSYRGMQICWCMFKLDILLIDKIADKIHCCSRTINTEIGLIKIAFNCTHMDLNKKSFFDRYPGYIFSAEKQVKVIEKRIRDRKKGRR